MTQLNFKKNVDFIVEIEIVSISTFFILSNLVITTSNFSFFFFFFLLCLMIYQLLKNSWMKVDLKSVIRVLKIFYEEHTLKVLGRVRERGGGETGVIWRGLKIGKVIVPFVYLYGFTNEINFIIFFIYKCHSNFMEYLGISRIVDPID